MFKDFLKSLPIATIIISYLFICGGLFLLGFWGTFDVDAFSIVQIWDIPKNFVASFMFSGGVAIIMILTMVFFINKASISVLNNTAATIKQTVNRRIAFYIVIIIASALYRFLNHSIIYWVWSSMILSMLIIAQIVKMGSFINLVNNFYLRVYVTTVIVMTPVMCFTSGKKNALSIYLNQSIQIVNIDVPNTIIQKSGVNTLKLLGFLGDKFIVSSLNNEKIFVLKQDAFNTIELEKR